MLVYILELFFSFFCSLLISLDPILMACALSQMAVLQPRSHASGQPFSPFSAEAGFQPCLIANPFSFSFSRPFIKSLFPENLQADKKGRPTTAGSKIKVCSILGRLQISIRDRIFQESGTVPRARMRSVQCNGLVTADAQKSCHCLKKGYRTQTEFDLAVLKPHMDIKYLRI